MGGFLEILLLLAAVAVIGYFAMEWWRSRNGATVSTGEGTDEYLALPELEPEPDPGERLPPGFIERRLRGAGVGLHPSVFGSILLILCLLAAIATLEIFPGNLAAAALVFLLAGWLVWSILGAISQRRSQRFEEKLVDAAAFMASSLQAGENALNALESAAAAAEKPVAGELQRVVTSLDTGADLEDALAPMQLEYDSEGVRLFANTLIAKSSAGGDLADILLKVSRIMRDRLAMRMRLSSELAGARLSAFMVAVMPYAIIPVMLWRRPEWFRALFATPLGLQAFLIALILQIIGLLWLRRMLRAEIG